MAKFLKWLGRVVFASVALVSVLFLALFFAGRREAAGHNQAAVEIARPPEQVFAHFTDFDKVRKWVPYVKEINGELREGGKLTVVTELGGGRTTMDEEILGFELGKRVELRLTSGAPNTPGFVEHAVFSLDDLPEGRTRVAAVADTQYRGTWLRLFEPYITLSAQRTIEADLARLKQNVEAEPVAPAGSTTGEK